MPSGSVSGARKPISTVPGAIADDLVGRRAARPERGVGPVEQGSGLAQRRPRLGVVLVREPGRRAGATLDRRPRTRRRQPGDCLGDEGHSAFAGGGLTWDGDTHSRNLREGISGA